MQPSCKNPIEERLPTSIFPNQVAQSQNKPQTKINFQCLTLDTNYLCCVNFIIKWEFNILKRLPNFLNIQILFIDK